MLWIFLIIINIFAYCVMWTDKIKSIRKSWRIREKHLWMLAIFGGVFGVWLGMQAPLYHKAWKRIFTFFIPIIAFFWIIFMIFFLKNGQ